jgi:hypothetical protein
MIPEAILACALALPALSAPKISEADVTFFKCLEAMAPEKEFGYKIISVEDPVINFSVLSEYARQVSVGGFLIIDIRDRPGFEKWLKSQRWERLPFYYREKEIWRKSS